MGAPSQEAPLAVHHLWRRVYDYCEDAFTSIQGYDRKDCELSADAAVDTYFTSAGRKRAPQKSYQLPKLGNLIELGKFRRMWTCDIDGNVYLSQETVQDVPLLWSQRRKCCVVFPGRSIRITNIANPTAEQHNLLRMWAKGRPAQVAVDAELPQPMMRPGMFCIAIEYYSDKFSHGSWKYYVHHHEKGVVAAQSVKQHSCGSPAAVWLHGGDLRITRHGLEG